MKLTAIILTTLFFASAGFAQEQAASPSASPTPKKGAPSEQRFKKFDKDQDGLLTLEEFSKGGSDAARSEASFKKRDTNADGKLTLEEYLSK